MNNYIVSFIGDVFFILFLGGVKMILEVFSNINVVCSSVFSWCKNNCCVHCNGL